MKVKRCAKNALEHGRSGCRCELGSDNLAYLNGDMSYVQVAAVGRRRSQSALPEVAGVSDVRTLIRIRHSHRRRGTHRGKGSACNRPIWSRQAVVAAGNDQSCLWKQKRKTLRADCVSTSTLTIRCRRLLARPAQNVAFSGESGKGAEMKRAWAANKPTGQHHQHSGTVQGSTPLKLRPETCDRRIKGGIEGRVGGRRRSG